MKQYKFKGNSTVRNFRTVEKRRKLMEKYGQLILYKKNKEKKDIEVKLYDETVWLNQNQLVDLFESSKANISEHINHIFQEGELIEEEVTAVFPTLQEATIAKNYLTEEELNVLNRIVSMYLDYAELQALNENPMTMRDWANELDYFIKMNRKDVLKTKGTVSHEEALEKARLEYKKYKDRISLNPTEVELHYIEATNELKKLTDKK